LGFNPDSWIGFPVRHTTPFQYTRYSEDTEARNNIVTTENVVLPPKVSADSIYRICFAVPLALEFYRSNLVLCWNDLLEKHLLPDAWIHLAASKALTIQIVEDLRTVSRKFPLGKYTAIGNRLRQVPAVIQKTISKADASSVLFGYQLQLTPFHLESHCTMPDRPAGHPTIAEK
jgi:hypothetical protein